MSELTHEELTRLLDYDPETGVFRWKVARGRGIKAGDVAGGNSSGGGVISLNGRQYRTRKIVWFFTNKEWPRNNLFVKNGDQFDDRIENIGMLPDKPKELTHEYLKECIDYNPKTGELKWKVTNGQAICGKDAFYIKREGNNYISLKTYILGRDYSTFRLIVFWVTGYMPSGKRVVIPIDNNVLNLKMDNIKVGDRSDANVKRRIKSGSSMRGGGHLIKDTKKYVVRITIGGKKKHLGTFPTEAEAHAAYMKAARKHYGALANDGYQHAMYEMEYEEVERPVEPEPEPVIVPVIEEKIEPVIQHSDDF